MIMTRNLRKLLESDGVVSVKIEFANHTYYKEEKGTDDVPNIEWSERNDTSPFKYI